MEFVTYIYVFLWTNLCLLCIMVKILMWYVWLITSILAWWCGLFVLGINGLMKDLLKLNIKMLRYPHSTPRAHWLDLLKVARPVEQFRSTQASSRTDYRASSAASVFWILFPRVFPFCSFTLMNLINTYCKHLLLWYQVRETHCNPLVSERDLVRERAVN